MNRFICFLKSEIVLCVSAALACLSMLLVPPSTAYLNYIDFRVISILFCLMAVVAWFTRLGVFQVLSQWLVVKSRNAKMLSLILVLLCFFSSMLITNDVALLTFVPLAVIILSVESQKRLIFTVVMQTIAANLGSMLTPVGNPQNLYLYSFYQVPILKFFQITAPIWTIGLVLIIGIMLCGKSQNITVSFPQKAKIERKGSFSVCLGLFGLCLLTVLHLIPYGVCLAVVFVTIAGMERSLLRVIDYGLLGTFFCFFIVVGNIGNIEAVRVWMTGAVQGRALVFSVLLSQAISNVPAAFMLSAFTKDAAALIQGTNIGGLGTLIASLASLISFKLYARSQGADTRRYLTSFTLYNTAILGILLFAVFLL